MRTSATTATTTVTSELEARLGRSASVPNNLRTGPHGSPPSLGIGVSDRRSLDSSDNNKSSNNTATLEQEFEERTSIFCPLPKKGLFYSKAYKEHKKKKKQLKQQRASDLAGANGGGSLESLSVDDEIPLTRDLTRRKRNSILKQQPSLTNVNIAQPPTNVTAYLAARVEAERPIVVDRERSNHAAMLLNGLAKSHMLDVTLVGSDQLPVKASKFVLACYSPVLEELFFKQKHNHGGGQEQQKQKKGQRKSESWLSWGQIDNNCNDDDDDDNVDNIVVDCCKSGILKAAIYHCFSGELPKGFDIESSNETVARNLAQLDQFAYMFRLGSLGEVTYRAARKLINKRPVLACAIFDELSYRLGRRGKGGMEPDSIKSYALDTMREMPMDTLLGGGVQWMKEDSVEAIMQDQDLDVDEFYMFKILKAWGSVDGAERQAAARRMSAHIELKYIEQELLMTQVKNSGYFEEKQIMEAVKLIEDSMADREDYEMERVLVEGAGKDIVNGVYVRVLDEVGISEEEVLFVKEADDGFSDVGLYLWKTKWNIAMCADYSNCFYSCEDDRRKRLGNELVPMGPWQTEYGGSDPPPTTTYLPITRAGRSSFHNNTSVTVIAPNLEEMIDPTIAEKRRSMYFDRMIGDTAEKRTMTLEQMMNLPIDQGDSMHS